MFVREKKNTTGTISVQVIDKSRGRYKVIKTIGSSADKNRDADYVTQGKQYIVKHTKQVSFDFQLGEDIHFYNTVYDNIESMQLLGPELILGKLFNEIGFDQIKDELFRHLIIARMIYPVSKL